MKPKQLIKWRSHAAFAKGLSFAVLLLSTLSSLALTPTVSQFVKWETGANAVSKRSSRGFAVKHFEIPLSVLQKDLATYLDPEVKNALIFQKNGEEYVRWIINPEDTKWHLELAAALEKRGLDTNQYTHFTGYLTASRSMILEDPDTGAQFSAKVSTNQTGGMWKDKKQDISDARQVRMVSDFVQDAANKTNFDHIIIENDPLQLGMKDVDQAMLVRSLADLPHGDHYYLPGFSALHEEVGMKIAAINGSTNPAEFWNEHYNKALARAVAEFAAHFGITYDSPHSQNFLIELDSKMKPTGRIVFRDFGDSYALAELFEALDRPDFLRKWEKSNIVKGRLHVSIGPMHGNTPPSWLSEPQYKKWGKDFYMAFEETFSRLTGVPEEELIQSRLSYQRPFSYFSKEYDLSTPAWKHYLEIAKCFAGSPVTKLGKPCPEHLLKKLKPAARILSREADEVFQDATRAEVNRAVRTLETPSAASRRMTARDQAALKDPCVRDLKLFLNATVDAYLRIQ